MVFKRCYSETLWIGVEGASNNDNYEWAERRSSYQRLYVGLASLWINYLKNILKFYDQTNHFQQLTDITYPAVTIFDSLYHKTYRIIHKRSTANVYLLNRIHDWSVRKLVES